MNRLAPLLALLLCIPSPARADEASHRAKAQEIVTLLHLNRAVGQLMDNLLRQTTAITTQRAGGTLTPEIQASLSDFQKTVTATMEPQIGWQAIEPEYVKRYADTFTDEELDAMVAFYKSPAGAAVVDKMPILNQQVAQLMQARVTALQPQMIQMLKDFENSVPQKAPSPSGPPAPASEPGPTPGKSSPQ
jgi:uncharacterized protein